MKGLWKCDILKQLNTVYVAIPNHLIPALSYAVLLDTYKMQGHNLGLKLQENECVPSTIISYHLVLLATVHIALPNIDTCMNVWTRFIIDICTFKIFLICLS